MVPVGTLAEADLARTKGGGGVVNGGWGGWVDG